MTVMEQQHLLLECGLSLVPSHITVTSLVLTHTHTLARLPACFFQCWESNSVRQVLFL